MPTSTLNPMTLTMSVAITPSVIQCFASRRAASALSSGATA